MSSNKSKPNQIPNNANVIEEATRKLIPIAMEQKKKEKEIHEQMLKQMELRLKQKVAQEKSISFGLEDKAFDRIDSLVTFISTLNSSTISNIDSIYSKKAAIHTQTDEDETSILLSKVSKLEKENELNQSKKGKYKKELKLLQSENQELKCYNDKLQKENKMHQQTIEELMKIKSNQDQSATQLQKENSELQCNIQNTSKTINDLNQMKKAFEDKIQIEISKKKIEEKVRNDYLNSNKCSFKILLVTHQLNGIISYLTLKDICNFKLSNKAISIEIANSNSIQRAFYTKVIDEKNKKINQLKNYDIKKEYLIQNVKLEQLIKEYAIAYKFPGKDLKGIIGKCINFLNKDVKTPLGITPIRAKTNINSSSINTDSGKATPTPQQTSTGYGYLFGGIKSMFGMTAGQGTTGANESSTTPGSGYHTPNPGANSSSIVSTTTTVMKSQSNSRGMSFSSNLPNDQFQKLLEDYDRKLIDDINNNESIIQSLYEFDFQSADDIKMYLNKFLKSNFPVDKLTAFIKEVCSGYSELLFASNRSLYEIRELELVKNALNERYKYYYSQMSENRPEVKSAQRALTFSKGTNDNQNIQIIGHGDNNNNEDLDIGTLLKEKEINKQMMNNLEIKSRLYQKKYEECKFDYDQFKNIFLKENRQLRFRVDLMLGEKNSLLKQISDFNQFFDDIKNNEGDKEKINLNK